MPDPHRGYAVVVVCPTWACNFRCWYCYQDHADVWMSDETVAAVERFLSRNALRTRYLWLDFFGGEPLLRTDQIVRLAGHAMRECADAGVRYHAGMTTNAYLLDPRTFARLHDVGVSHYQITLDGVPEFHDRQRVLASGRGTWDRIWANLTHIRDSSARVKVTLRVHFRADDLGPAVRLMEEYVLPTFGDDERFALQFAEIRRLGGPEDGRIREATPTELAAALQTLDATLRRPNQLVGFGRGDFECYAAKPDTLVIQPDGELAKCTVSFERVGQLAADGGLRLDAARSEAWAGRASHCPSCPRSATADAGVADGRRALPLLA